MAANPQRLAVRVAGAVLVLLAMLVPAVAEDRGVVQQPAWQVAIAAQIEAFRRGDADAAFGLAGAGFHEAFADARQFAASVRLSGYAPLLDARSFSFQGFTIEPGGDVVQEVRVLAPDQRIYLATYRMTLEPEGWRVQSVGLERTRGVGI